MISCPECGREISDAAAACPNCGYPVKKDARKELTGEFERQAADFKKEMEKRGGCLKPVLIFLLACVVMIGISVLSGGGKKESDIGGSLREYEATAYARKIIEDNLKNPSSAKYGSLEAEHLGGNKYKVTGWVEATNTFGGTVRQNFEVTFTATKNGYTSPSASLY